MDNHVPGVAGGKRRRDDGGELEDVKDAVVKSQGRWTPRPEEDSSFKQNPNHNDFSVENWIRMQQQKSEMASGVGPPALNLHQRAMAAAALQDLRCLESSKRFYQNQVPPQLQFQQQHQQPLPSSSSLQPLPTPAEKSNGSLRELSPGLLPQSPLRLPPPLIRTPPLYAEADLHNGSPTSSSSSPYPGLQQNMPVSRPQYSTGAALQLQDLSNEQVYTSMVQASQNGSVHQQQPQQQVHQAQKQPTLQHQHQAQQMQHQQQAQQIQHQQPLQQQACLSDGNSSMLRELQQQGNSWYPSMRDTCTYAEAPSGASSSRLPPRMETPSQSATQMVTPANYSLPTPEFSAPRLMPTFPTPHPCQTQGGGYRDGSHGSHEQNLQPQFDAQGPMGGGMMGGPRRCPSPSSSRLGMCPPQGDAQGRRLLSGPSAVFSFGGDAPPPNPSPPMMIKTGLDENPSLLHRSMPCSMKPVRSFTKVYKLGSITRAVDVRRFTNYTELRVELARMFNLEGQLDQKLGWQLVFIDNENDLLLVGDDPWEDFVKSVRGIRILSPREVYFYMNEEALNNSCPPIQI